MRGNKILYSFGNLAAAVSNQAFLTYIAFFYVDVIKFPKLQFGLVWFLFGLWNAINDPLFGQWSDHTRTRWGRRIPFMVWGTVPFAVFFFLLWVPPFQASHPTLLFLYLLCSMFLFDTFFTLVVLNWTALFPEMYPTLRERSTVSAWRQLFGIIGLIFGMAVPPILYQGLGWTWMGGILAVITLATMALALLGSKEDPNAHQPPEVRLFKALHYTLTSKAFLTFAAANFGITLAMGIVQVTFAFFAKYILGVEGLMQSLLLGAAFLLTMPMLVLWRQITIKHGPRPALIGTAAAFGLVCLGFLLVHSLTLAFVVCALLGVGLAGMLMIPDILLADIVDEDELRSGERREGMFFGINGFAIRLAGAFQGVILTLVLSVFGYNENAAVQGATALRGIRFLMGIVPMLALLITVGAIYLYPLHGRRLAEIKEQAARKHAAAGAAAPPA